MSLYYFHIRDGDAFDEDTIGVELPDLDTARQEASLAAREMLAEKMAHGLHVNGQSFEICDGNRRLLWTLPFREVLNVI